MNELIAALEIFAYLHIDNHNKKRIGHSCLTNILTVWVAQPDLSYTFTTPDISSFNRISFNTVVS